MLVELNGDAWTVNQQLAKRHARTTLHFGEINTVQFSEALSQTVSCTCEETLTTNIQDRAVLFANACQEPLG